MLMTRNLWRWGLMGMGTVLIAHGLFSKNMRMRDSRTWKGAWRGKIVTKPWQIVYMRSLFALIGAAMIFCALSPNFP
jgi:hypothetical protein